MSNSIEAIGSKKTNVINFIDNFKKMSLNGDAKFSVQMPIFGYGYANTQVNAADNNVHTGSMRTKI